MRTSWIFRFCLLFVSVVFLRSSYAQESTRWGLPGRAKMRIGKAPVTEIAYSPDGRRIAAATHKDIWMYDARSGVALKFLTGHTDSVLTVAFSPSGNTLASGGADGTVRGWNVRSGTLFETIEGHGGSVRSVRFSPDGSTLASAGEDKLIRLWDVWNVELKRMLEGHLESVDTIAFSPDGLTIASGGRDGAIMLWNVQTGNKSHTLEGHAEPVRSVAFSPDGLTLASAGRPHSVNPRLSRDGRIKLWDTRTGEQERTLEGHSHTVGCVAFSPNGDVLASGGGWYDDTVRFWDTRTGEEGQILEGHTEGVDSIAFSPDGGRLATASRGSIRLWDTRTGENLRTLVHTVGRSAFSPDGKTLAVGGAEAVEIWDAHSGEKLRTLPGLTGGVLAFSPDGTTLVIRRGHHFILLCDVHSGEVLQTFEAHTDYFVSAALSPDGRLLASGSGDHPLADTNTNSIRFWNARTGELLQTLDGHSAPVTSVDFLPNSGGLASASWDGTILLWDFTTPATWGEIKQMTAVGDSNHVPNLSAPASASTPTATLLLPNYPNPFNPETWIPYQLAHPAEVVLTIYDIRGQAVRKLEVGHQRAGAYRSRERAAYWDGRNEMGETVANGVYFYTLTAGDFTATRKMLVGK